MASRMRKIGLIMVLLVGFVLTSCTKSDYDERYWEQISIDPENLDTYEWLDIADGVYQSYQTKNNGEKYTIERDGDVITFTSTSQMTEVRLIKKVVGKGYVNLPIMNNTVTQENVNPDWAFRIYYQ